MDINFQLNNIREQYKNMENQFGFLIAQSQNVIGLANIQSSIFNLAIQIFNMGIQMVNIATQIPNIGMDIINYKIQIQNIGCQIQNLGNQMNNINNMMPMNMNNMGMMEIPNNNMIFNNINNNNDDLMIGFKMNDENLKEYNSINNKPKMSILFQTTRGWVKSIIVDYGTPVCDTLKKYLIEINKPEFINADDRIAFIFNAKKIRFDDKTKIEDFFGLCANTKVIVND